MAHHPIPRNKVGPDGMVPIWSISEGKWSRRHPVDAREMLDFGQGSLEAPATAPEPPEPRPQPKPTAERVTPLATSD